MKLFNFYGTEIVKIKKKKKLKTIQNLLTLQVNHFSTNLTKAE